MIMMKLVDTYATCLNGSNTWDILSPDCEKLYRSYNVAIRSIFDLDQTTHRYMIEPLSNYNHLRTLLAARYVSFHDTLRNTRKTPVSFLTRLYERDHRTVMGKTLATLAKECEMSDICGLKPSVLKKCMIYMTLHEDQKWRVGVGLELLQNYHGSLDIPGFSREEVKSMLDFICTT